MSTDSFLSKPNSDQEPMELSDAQLNAVFQIFAEVNLQDWKQHWPHDLKNMIKWPDGWFVGVHPPKDSHPDWGFFFGYDENTDWDPEAEFLFMLPGHGVFKRKGAWRVDTNWYIMGQLMLQFPEVKKQLWYFQLLCPHFFATWSAGTDLFAMYQKEITEEDHLTFLHQSFDVLSQIEDTRELLTILGASEEDLTDILDTEERTEALFGSFVLSGSGSFQASATGYVKHWCRNFKYGDVQLWLQAELSKRHPYFDANDVNWNFRKHNIHRIPKVVQDIQTEEPCRILLEQNHIQELPDWMADCDLDLQVDNNPLSHLPTWFLSKMEDITYNGYSVPSPSISKHSNPQNICSIQWNYRCFGYADTPKLSEELCQNWQNARLQGCINHFIQNEVGEDIQSINFANIPVSQIPENIDQLPHIQQLLFPNTNITEVPHSLLNLPNLTLIDLSNNPLTEACKSWLREHFAGRAIFDDLSPKLQKDKNSIQAFLQSKSLEDVIQGIALLEDLAESPDILRLLVGYSPKAQTLDEIKAHCKSFPHTESIWLWIAGVRRKWNLEDEPIATFYQYSKEIALFDNLQYLSHLKEITLEYHAHLDHCIETIFPKMSLTKLSLSGLKSIPTGILALSSLQDLSLSGDFTEVPEGLSQLTQLTKLQLGGKLTVLPKDFTQCTSLQNVNLDSNALTELPANIDALIDLQDLHAGHNQLHHLPESLNNCTKLNNVFLVGNPLESLPTQIPFLKISPTTLWACKDFIGVNQHLTHLESPWSNLTSIPVEICNCRNLQTLSLWRNPITALPPEIGQLTQLTFLEMYGNSLTSLPTELGNCTQLVTINFSGGQLTSLPSTLVNCQQLETLQVSNNPLTQIPEELAALPNLDSFDVFGSQIPEEELQRLAKVFERNHENGSWTPIFWE